MDCEKVDKIIAEIVMLSDRAIERRIGFFKIDPDDLKQILNLCAVIEKEFRTDLRYGWMFQQTAFVADTVRTALCRDADPSVRADLTSDVSGLTSAWAKAKSQIGAAE